MYQNPIVMQPPSGQNRQNQVGTMNDQSKLFVSNINENVKEQDIRQAFLAHNINIDQLFLPIDQLTHKNKGYAFLTLQSAQYAKHAMKEMNHTEILGKKIRITFQARINQFPPGSNIFVKNIDKHVTNQEFETFFSHYGGVFSVKLTQNTAGENLGYGYVQFKTAQDAKSCLDDQNRSQLNSRNLEVEVFTKRSSRVGVQTSKNNIYVKNIPFKKVDNEEENQKNSQKLQEEIEEKFSSFGMEGDQKREIISAKVLFHFMDETTEKPFAFICYKDPKDAQEAVEQLNDNPFNDSTEEKLFVGFAQSKKNRRDEFRKQSKNKMVFFKNLIADITQEQIEKVLANYGECKVLSLKEQRRTGPNGQTTVKKYGWAQYTNDTDAQKAILIGNSDNQIRKFFHEGKIMICKLQEKSKRAITSGPPKNRQLGSQNAGSQDMSAQMQQMMQFMQMMMFQFMPMMMGGMMPQMQHNRMLNNFNQQSQRYKNNRGNNRHGNNNYRNRQYNNNYQNRKYNNNNNQNRNNYGNNNNSINRQQPPMQNNRGNPMNNNMNPQMQQQQQQMNLRQQQIMQQKQQQQMNAQQQRTPQKPQNPQNVPPQMNPQYNQQLLQQQPNQQRQQVQPQRQVPPQQRQPQQQAPPQMAQQQQIKQQQQQMIEANEQHINDLFSKINDFLSLQPQQQKQILGELLYPKISQMVSQDYAGKVTGMLIDLDVAHVKDIAALLQDKQKLNKRVNDAMIAIRKNSQQ